MEFKGCRIKNTVAVNELITISKQRFSEGYFFKGESHNFYEFVCVLDGSVGITAGKEILVLDAGQMIIHEPLEFHAIWERENSNPTCIVISFSSTAFPMIFSRVYNVSDPLLKDIDRIYEASKDIFEMQPFADPFGLLSEGKTEYDYGMLVCEIKENMQFAASKLRKELELFLMRVLEAPSDMGARNSDNSSENYVKILEILEAHIDDNLNMGELSRLCGMSVPLIEKIMYKYLRRGAMSYYNSIRMNKAHDLLSGGKSVKSVARAMGFSTQNYFSLSFKKYFGYPPSQVKGK